MPSRAVEQSIVGLFERVVAAVGDRAVEDYRMLTDRTGDKPFGWVDLTPDEQALRWVPDWFVLGNAAPVMHDGTPLALAYWQAILQKMGAHYATRLTPPTDPQTGLPQPSILPADPEAARQLVERLGRKDTVAYHKKASRLWQSRQAESLAGFTPQHHEVLQALHRQGLHAGVPTPSIAELVKSGHWQMPAKIGRAA